MESRLIGKYTNEFKFWVPFGALILYTKSYTMFWLMLDIKSWCGSDSAHWSLDYNVYSWRFMRAAATYK